LRSIIVDEKRLLKLQAEKWKILHLKIDRIKIFKGLLVHFAKTPMANFN